MRTFLEKFDRRLDGLLNCGLRRCLLCGNRLAGFGAGERDLASASTDGPVLQLAAIVTADVHADDLDTFVAQLKDKGVEVLDSVDEGYGKFAWLLDPDGVKIELWEQVLAPE